MLWLNNLKIFSISQHSIWMKDANQQTKEICQYAFIKKKNPKKHEQDLMIFLLWGRLVK